MPINAAFKEILSRPSFYPADCPTEGSWVVIRMDSGRTWVGIAAYDEGQDSVYLTRQTNVRKSGDCCGERYVTDQGSKGPKWAEGQVYLDPNKIESIYYMEAGT